MWLLKEVTDEVWTAKEGTVTVQCEGLPDAKIDFCNDVDHKKYIKKCIDLR